MINLMLLFTLHKKVSFFFTQYVCLVLKQYDKIINNTKSCLLKKKK